MIVDEKGTLFRCEFGRVVFWVKARRCICRRYRFWGGSIILMRGIRGATVIARFVLHGFHHSLQFWMALSTFSLKVSVEFLESIEPRLELDNEVEFFVTSLGMPGQSEVHPSFDTSMKLWVVKEWFCTTEQWVYVPYGGGVVTESLAVRLSQCI